MNFELRALPPPSDNEKAFWFIFSEDKLYVELQGKVAHIPFTNSIKNNLNSIYLGRLDSSPCFAAELSDKSSTDPILSPISLRQLYGLIEDEIFWLAARAYHLINWSKNNQYCGRCGGQTISDVMEHSKLCPKCCQSIYPKISPAVIVAITKEDKILLAKNIQSKTGFYSVLAGFVEPGETMEECVEREIFEEVGIQVKNIKYFGSQPWPFPDSLMVGFTAEYAGGELNIDPKELSDAAWFAADELPEVPGKLSISRKLIDWFVANNK
ncbi:MAG: pyrophosphatase [Clostridia bacterium]|jgi:NAD+ diphosphatase|nr:pyrophosphatase [Clostridia bacterium]